MVNKDNYKVCFVEPRRKYDDWWNAAAGVAGSVPTTSDQFDSRDELHIGVKQALPPPPPQPPPIIS